ncbi:hypothetical protein Ab1vBOLIVR5_gp243 [Agrobacterium phage OLIVR5]|uniref:Uncharacterized protein n=1 Tax=Agrobacterium phage OLIVR5 TaxID=2723773 RepID=A0A858MTY5_9CAUD|nr:hypothetical protein KNU99_gp158 [Agrobacterium phage OLIVR5]QIW87891.1 hypothetical protein Ab1vBOLIVR5_gp243 [Agrobacterium phage OLIVR5]QIW88156.1 hypothetical protein Ab1vBOLIVR6_gp249 [Agrobacterium phage OLIVR6]
MRSYETGLYDVLTDGNVNSMVKIITAACATAKKNGNPIKAVSVSCPDPSFVKGGDDALEALRKKFSVCGADIFLFDVDYGSNAKENRYVVSGQPLDYEALNITYFKHNREENEHTIFVCPGSPRPENPLYDESEFDYFQEAILNSDMTFFYNWNQARFGAYHRCFEAAGVTFEMSRNRVIDDPLPRFHYYFPYRLTDKDYLFDEFISDLPNGTVVAVTDPNESLGRMNALSVVQSEKNPGVTLMKIDPRTHLDIVRSIIIDNEIAFNSGKKYKPLRQIVITSRLSKTLHMGPAEMFSIAYPKGATRKKDINHFKFIEAGTTEFEFETESERALGR